MLTWQGAFWEEQSKRNDPAVKVRHLGNSASVRSWPLTPASAAGADRNPDELQRTVVARTARLRGLCAFYRRDPHQPPVARVEVVTV